MSKLFGLPLYSTLAPLDARCITHHGISGKQLMENAGRALAQVILKRMPDDKKCPVVIVCGPGNNGGDGLVAARCLREVGYQKLSVYVMQPSNCYQGDAAYMLQQLQSVETPVDINELSEVNGSIDLPEQGIVVDAMFGTGLARLVEGVMASVVSQINQWRVQGQKEVKNRWVVSVDMPSGVSSKSGQVLGEAIQADVTVTFEAEKWGHWLNEGKFLRGALEVVPIGFPLSVFDEIPSVVKRLSGSQAQSLFPPVVLNAHKYQKGHVAVLAGSCGMTGAASLVCQSVLYSGCGVVTWAGPDELLGRDFLKPEVLTASTDAQPMDKVLGGLKQVGSVVAGPGCGHRLNWTKQLEHTLRYCYDHQIPCVLDADALTVLPEIQKSQTTQRLGRHVVCTPHVGEASQLLNQPADVILSDLPAAARAIQQRYGGVVVLKASTMVIADETEVWINPTGHLVLGTAGSGDVLAGLIGSLLAQRLNALSAALLGCYAHGAVGQYLAKQPSGPYGVSASTLLDALPVVLNQLQESPSSLYGAC